MKKVRMIGWLVGWCFIAYQPYVGYLMLNPVYIYIYIYIYMICKRLVCW